MLPGLRRPYVPSASHFANFWKVSVLAHHASWRLTTLAPDFSFKLLELPFAAYPCRQPPAWVVGRKVERTNAP